MQEIFQRVAEGEAQYHLVDELNHRNIPNTVGGKWDRGAMGKMLRKTVYIGECRINGFDGVIPCEPIIEKSIWQAVQIRLEDTKKQYRENRGKFEYFMTGKLLCGKCGKPMGENSTKRKNQEKTHRY